MEVRIGIASIPQRAHNLLQTVSSLYNQAPEIHIFLDGYTEIPYELARWTKCVIHQRDHKIGDAGKFLGLENFRGYYITCDDDLLYSEDYVEKLISKIEYYDRTCVVSYHGRIMQATPIKSYYSKRDTAAKFACLNDLPNDVFVQIAGTGCMGFHTDTFTKKEPLSIQDFKHPNMADIWMGLKCQRLQIPQVVAEHKAKWITAQVTRGFDIYRSSVKRDKVQTETINKFGTWNIYAYKAKEIDNHLAYGS